MLRPLTAYFVVLVVFIGKHAYYLLYYTVFCIMWSIGLTETNQLAGVEQLNHVIIMGFVKTRLHQSHHSRKNFD